MPGLGSNLSVGADVGGDERLRLVGEVGQWKGHELAPVYDEEPEVGESPEIGECGPRETKSLHSFLIHSRRLL